MKKVNLLWALVLLLCLSSCNSEPKDAKECVMQFLQCLKDGDTEQGTKITDTMPINKDGKTASMFMVAQKYNPNWNPKKVILSEKVDTIIIKNKKLAIVQATYNNKHASFYVNIDDVQHNYSINNTDGFLNIDATTTSKNGIVIKSGTNSTDFKFLLHCTIDIDGVISCINKFCKNGGDKKLYPNSKSFGDYIIIDSIAPKIQSVAINFNKAWEIHNFVVQCTGGKTFYVQPHENDSYSIKNSKGVYDFEKKMSDLCTAYNYNYSITRPATDKEAVEAANQAEKKIKQLVFQRDRVEHWKKVGLVITRTWVARGTNNNNYPTSGLGVRIFNPTNKNIKYIVFHTIARNGVDDVIGRETCRGIGPIEPQEAGEYGFKTLFMDYNSIVSRVSVSSVEIIYTDGSRKAAKGSDVIATSDDFDENWW